MIRPILFNTEMVKAILSGSKITTRRCVKPQPQVELKHKLGYCVDGDKKDIGKFGFASTECGGKILYVTPPAKVGDVLWVRETWQQVYETEIFEAGKELNIRNVISNFDDISKVCVGLSTEYATPTTKPRNKYYVYKTDDIQYADEKYSLRWKPSLHMPKEAARIFLRVKDVRVERLDDMRVEDAVHEGINMDGLITNRGIIEYRVWNRWNELWDSTIPKKDLPVYGSEANPWVWVIEFERCDKPDEFTGSDN